MEGAAEGGRTAGSENQTRGTAKGRNRNLTSGSHRLAFHLGGEKEILPKLLPPQTLWAPATHSLCDGRNQTKTHRYSSLVAQMQPGGTKKPRAEFLPEPEPKLAGP